MLKINSKRSVSTDYTLTLRERGGGISHLFLKSECYPTMQVKIIADSCSHEGKRITTFQLRYPRFIHSEVMTHRVFSRNASSSRAIPVIKLINQVEANPAMPVH